jgi:hypothetical protein
VNVTEHARKRIWHRFKLPVGDFLYRLGRSEHVEHRVDGEHRRARLSDGRGVGLVVKDQQLVTVYERDDRPLTFKPFAVLANRRRA